MLHRINRPVAWGISVAHSKVELLGELNKPDDKLGLYLDELQAVAISN